MRMAQMSRIGVHTGECVSPQEATGRVRMSQFIRLNLKETSMADVIRIQERMPRGPRKSVKQPADATILLFTGIRYERSEDYGRVIIPADKGETIKH